MNSLYILIPLSIGLLIAAICILIWATKSGQYDDLSGQSERIIFDDHKDHPQLYQNSKTSRTTK